MSQNRGSQANQNPSQRADVGSHATGDGTTDVAWKENVLGDARGGRVQNVSWGAIFAGVVTFLAIVVLFSLLTAAFGLSGSGVGSSIMGIIAVLLGFFGGGWVAGTMGVRGGLVHGFITWATSVLAVIVLVVMLTVSAAGAVGGALGSVIGGLGNAAGPNAEQVDPSAVPTPSNQDIEKGKNAAQKAADQAKATAEDVADATQKGAVWGFFGLLLGAIIASLGGLLGSRAVNSRRAVDGVSSGKKTDS